MKPCVNQVVLKLNDIVSDLFLDSPGIVQDRSCINLLGLLGLGLGLGLHEASQELVS